MKNQTMKMALMIVSAVGIMTSALLAQDEIGDHPAKGFIYNGVESSAGNQDPVSAFQYGTAFVLTNLGEVESRFLTVSVNSRAVFKDVVITGGTWSVAVFRDNVCVGTVYGEVISGDIHEIVNKKGEVIGKQTRTDLVGVGGTGIFDNEVSQQINGSLNMKTDLLTKTKKTTAFETLNF